MRKRILVFYIFVLFISFLLFFIDNQETIKLRKIKDIEILENLDNEYVYFGRKTCSSCTKFEKNMKEFGDILPHELYYFDTDFWRDKDKKILKQICEKYNVDIIPKIVLIKDGKYMGELNLDKMMNTVKRAR